MEKSKVKKEGNFVPPDGGYGWIIMLAAGFSNLSVFPVLQQFGLLFRDRFTQIGMSSSETTAIANVNAAMMYGAGLMNGPVFRAFSYRQVALAGATITVIALFFTVYAYNFITYLLALSILYGTGIGILGSANALALNTYWNKRRRIATGFSWTITGLGPIISPYVVTGLSPIYGESGTIFILSGFALHAIACALLLQPVQWHSKSPDDKESSKLDHDSNNFQDNIKHENSYFSQNSNKKVSTFSSQYLFNEDDPVNTGYEITDPGVPMMTRANDGYFSRSQSKATSREGSKKSSMFNLFENRSRKASADFDETNKTVGNSLALNTNCNKPRQKTTLHTFIPETDVENCPTLEGDLKGTEKLIGIVKAENFTSGITPIKYCKIDNPIRKKQNAVNYCNLDRKNQGFNNGQKYLEDISDHQDNSNSSNHDNEILQQASYKLEQYAKENKVENEATHKLLQSEDKVIGENKSADEQLTLCQKVVIFFDLDLLKDFTFLNLMLGLTLATFSEINFSLLTPFFLLDFGMTRPEVASFMSLLAVVDILSRFSVSLIASRIGWHNNTFYLFGVLTIAVGRVLLAHCQDRIIVLCIAVVIGFGKGLRTVFMALVIPTYVPLDKLPGASGLQLITSGITFLALGPFVGWIKDNASTTVTLHCLNIFTWLTAISWTAEKYFKKPPKK